MAIFSVEIDDNDVERVINALASNYRRPEKIDNPDFNPRRPENPGNNPRKIDNPESVAEFANRMVRNFIEENCVAYEVKEAKRVAGENARNNAKPIIRDPER